MAFIVPINFPAGGQKCAGFRVDSYSRTKARCAHHEAHHIATPGRFVGIRKPRREFFVSFSTSSEAAVSFHHRLQTQCSYPYVALISMNDRQPNPFRIIGVSEGASTDEITAAVADAKERAANDPKKLKEIEEAENQIIFLGLRNRTKDVGRLNLERLGLGPRGKPTLAPNIQFPTQLPKWSYIKESYRLNEMFEKQLDLKSIRATATIFGMLGLFSVISPASVTAYLPLGFLCCIAYHYQKQKKWIRSVPFASVATGLGLLLGTWLPKIGFPIFGTTPMAFAGIVTYTLYFLVCIKLR